MALRQRDRQGRGLLTLWKKFNYHFKLHFKSRPLSRMDMVLIISLHNVLHRVLINTAKFI